MNFKEIVVFCELTIGNLKDKLLTNLKLAKNKT